MESVNRFNFRAWDGDEMHHNVSVCYGKPVRHGYGVFMTANSKVWDANLLMQSTGLTDKNGVEIYEGDILYHPSGCFGDYSKPSGISVVKHEACGNESGFYTAADVDSGWNEHEVIGNIYEHPEILKGEQQ